jgi:hypothetical protein
MHTTNALPELVVRASAVSAQAGPSISAPLTLNFGSPEMHAQFHAAYMSKPVNTYFVNGICNESSDAASSATTLERRIFPLGKDLLPTERVEAIYDPSYGFLQDSRDALAKRDINKYRESMANFGPAERQIRDKIVALAKDPDKSRVLTFVCHSRGTVLGRNVIHYIAKHDPDLAAVMKERVRFVFVGTPLSTADMHAVRNSAHTLLATNNPKDHVSSFMGKHTTLANLLSLNVDFARHSFDRYVSSDADLQRILQQLGYKLQVIP